MGESWNLSAMKEPTVVAPMLIVGLHIWMVLWDLPNSSDFLTLQQLCLIQMCTAGKPRCFQIREKFGWGVRWWQSWVGALEMSSFPRDSGRSWTVEQLLSNVLGVEKHETAWCAWGPEEGEKTNQKKTNRQPNPFAIHVYTLWDCSLVWELLKFSFSRNYGLSQVGKIPFKGLSWHKYDFKLNWNAIYICHAC